MNVKKDKFNIEVRPSDVIWGYIAQIFSIGTGFLILPFILRLLTVNEIGLNYLMGTIAGLVALLDFGFSAQFGRNFTHVFGGAQKLQKEGIQQSSDNERDISYHLLATLIKSAKFVYKRISLIALGVMLTAGTIYIYNATEGFSNVKHSLYIWIVFSLSTYFNIYYSYYQALLRGRGLLKEANQITIYGRISQLTLTISLLYMGAGLMGIAISNFIYPFFTRYLTYRVFFTSSLKSKLNKCQINRSEVNDLIFTIWYNAKKLGLVFVGSYLISKVGMFIAGIFLPLSEIASYGIMLQVFGFVIGFASNFFNTFQPRLNYLRVQGNKLAVIKEFALSMSVFYIVYLLGSLSIIFAGPLLLKSIGSNVLLPPLMFMIAYALLMLLEQNHSLFAILIATRNSIPFVKPSLISG
ncbi:MAG: O-unit flippase-like protein, partial [Lentimicrobiaceae bacterium]|nr:O-unit flippase-like protein [Lentimicrobiaceae bacterium]